MNVLFSAIMTHFGLNPGSGFYNDIGGRLHLYKAPQENIFPYCVYFPAADDADDDFTDDHEDFEIQFNIFSQDNSALEAGNLLESLKTMFDDCSLSVSGWNHIKFQRINTLTNNDTTQVPPIYGYSVMYSVLLEKQR